MAQWAQVIQERKASGENVKEYCQNRGLSRDAYFYWQKKLKEAAYEQLAVMKTAAGETNLIAATGFAEIKIRDEQSLAPCTGGIPGGQLTADISGIKVTIDAAYPVDQLACLLRGLRKPC